MDAELQASYNATCHAIWLKKLLHNLGLNIGTTPIYNDNNGALALTKNPNNWDKLKHFVTKVQLAQLPLRQIG
jgi:hypothetical protein